MLTEKQVAAQLGLAVSTLQSWRSANIGPAFVKLSRNAVRYRQGDVDAWAADRRQSTLESS